MIGMAFCFKNVSNSTQAQLYVMLNQIGVLDIGVVAIKPKLIMLAFCKSSLCRSM